jgi:hypothetical protein
MSLPLSPIEALVLRHYPEAVLLPDPDLSPARDPAARPGHQWLDVWTPPGIFPEEEGCGVVLVLLHGCPRSIIVRHNQVVGPMEGILEEMPES